MIGPRPHADAEGHAVFRDASQRTARQRLTRAQQAHRVEPARHARPRAFSWLSRVVTVLALVAAVVWFFSFRPVVLGGPASYVMVSGISMEPLYHNGDMVILRTQSHYEPGDIIAYKVPSDDIGAGHLVIHRIVGSDEKGLITKGDNRKGEDLWRPQDSDVIGKAWIHLPGLGKPLSLLHAPLPLAAVAGAFTVYFVLTFSRPKRRSETD